MTRSRTARIKPATRNALMDQLALAADEIIRQRELCWAAMQVIEAAQALMEHLESEPPRRWWQVWK